LPGRAVSSDQSMPGKAADAPGASRHVFIF
jgi:hypothetical protein